MLRALFYSLLLIALPLSAEEQPETPAGLFGNWGGLKTQLEDSGITIDFIQTTDYVANVSGGIRRTSGVLGNTDITFTINTEKADLWSNGTFFIYALGDYGKDPSSYIGDSQVTDNIEAYDTAKLYEAWYNHDFLEGRFSILFGLHDYNSEFDALEYAGNLINSSFGISRDISQVGPSIFSTTSLATRVKFIPTQNSYIQAAIYDGVPGDPNNPRGTRIRFENNDGTFSALEVGLIGTEENYYKIALGTWYHTAEFEDTAGNLRDTNYGSYLIGESKVVSEEDESQGLGFFTQLGSTEGDRNQVDYYVGAGFAYTGLLPCRDEDTLAFGFGYAHNGYTFRNLNEGFDSSEQVFELSYIAKILPYFSVQPDIQYVLNPSSDPSLDDAVVTTLRTEVAF